MDRFKDQLDALKDAEKDLAKTFKERAVILKNADSTGKVGRFDHLLKRSHE